MNVNTFSLCRYRRFRRELSTPLLAMHHLRLTFIRRSSGRDAAA